MKEEVAAKQFGEKQEGQVSDRRVKMCICVCYSSARRCHRQLKLPMPLRMYQSRLSCLCARTPPTLCQMRRRVANRPRLQAPKQPRQPAQSINGNCTPPVSSSALTPPASFSNREFRPHSRGIGLNPGLQLLDLRSLSVPATMPSPRTTFKMLAA